MMRCVVVLALATAAVGPAAAATAADDFQQWIAPRLTPLVTGFSPAKPTPASTSAWLARDSQLSRFPRTEVDVLEKCCPHISHFAVRDYPSALEDDGWMPSLTFHAFKFTSRLLNCWQIVRANATTGSQRWQRIHYGITTTSPSASDSFCLPTENLLPDDRVFIFYIVSADKRASLVSQPIRSASHEFFGAFTPAGWNASKPRFQRIYPLAYYVWKTLMPMPPRLISDVRMHATEAHEPPKCSNGYTIVPGNLNDNFVGDPVVYFCVRYSCAAVVDPRFDLASQPNHDHTFLTDIVIQKTTLAQMRYRRHDPEYAQRAAECQPPYEIIPSKLEFWNRRADADAERKQQLDALNETFAQLQLPTNYTVFTGAGQWLTFCMLKQPLVTTDGNYRAASEFVNRLYLNLSQIARRKRLGVVYNIDVPEATKQSPFGRIHYEDEDAKDEAADEDGVFFDEL